MEVQSVWQTVIPDSLLVEIFGHLDIEGLGQAGQVCRQWRRVALDDILWRNIAWKNWGITGKIHPGCSSWHDEVTRLRYHVPSVESEVYEVHQDEVLDVAISHRGEYFCTTSKDVQATLWQLDYPSFVLRSVDLKSRLDWELTQYSAFNDSDTLVFVCGVSTPAYTQIGSGAVFTVPEMDLVCAIDLDPPTLFGAWLTDRTFLGGSLAEGQDSIKIDSYEITDEELAARVRTDNWDIENIYDHYHKTSTPVFTFRGNKYHQMNLLVAKVSYDRERSILKSDNTNAIGNKSNNAIAWSDVQLSEAGDQSRFCDINSGAGVSVKDGASSKNLNTPMDTADGKLVYEDWTRNGATAMDTSNADNIGALNDDKYTLDSDEVSGRIRTQVESHKNLSAVENQLLIDSSSSQHQFENFVCDKDCGNGGFNNSRSDWDSKPVLSSKKTDSSAEHRNTRKWHDSSPKFINSADKNMYGFRSDSHMTANSHMTSESHMDSEYGSCDLQTVQRTYVVFVTGDHDAIAVHELKEDRDPSEDPTSPVAKIDNYFHLKDCYITGISLSCDHRFLFFNYRGYDPKESINFEPGVPLYEKIFSQELNVGTIDLTTMSRLPDREFCGHIAFSLYPAWYICLDASPSFVGSGSEDGKGYIWDLHHGVLLSTLQHKEGVVNGIAFCPNDEETCITVCDDKLIKIWRSRNRLNTCRLKGK